MGRKEENERGAKEKKKFFPHGQKNTRNFVSVCALYVSYGINAVPFTEERWFAVKREGVQATGNNNNNKKLGYTEQ